MFSVNQKSITYMKVKIIMYLGKSFIIAKKNVLFVQKQTEIQIFKLYASYAHEVDVKR